MSYIKGVRSRAEGNRSLLKDYGGSPGNGPVARQSYATGGAVKGFASGGSLGNPSLNEGLSAAGSPAKKSLARPGRKMPGKKGAKGGKPNVNVIIAQSPPKGDAPPMPPMGAGPSGPPPGPPMPPPGPGPGGPPMPMRASGGRISNLGKYAHGGKVKRADGGWTGEGDSGKKLREDAEDIRTERNLTKGAAGLVAGSATAPLTDRAAANYQMHTNKVLRGVPRVGAALGILGAPIAGAAYAAKKGIDAITADSRAKKLEKDADEAEGRASGGRVPPQSQGGAGGGEGRLAKMRAAKSKKYGGGL